MLRATGRLMPTSRSCAAEGASIVLIGRFNPAIFQPAWLAANRLIRAEEATNAEGVVFSNDVAAFKADWLRLQVTPERFEAITDDAAHIDPLRDLVLSVFGLLEHTPFHEMGMNRHLHFRMESPDVWHRFGDVLVPKTKWAGLMAQPGLRSLIVEGYRPDAAEATIQVKVEPSVKVQPGIYFAINHHFGFKDPNSGRRLMAILLQQWHTAQVFARHSAEQLLAQV